MGVLPLSHIGHKIDLLPVLQQLGGYSYVNLAPNEVFSIQEQKNVISLQWQDPCITFRCYKSVGVFLHSVFADHIFDEINIVVGQDRVKYAERIVYGLQNETFKELNYRTSNIKCNIIVPDTFRDHGFSGTTMREAAAIGDYECFRAHLGDMFTDEECRDYMGRVRGVVVS